MWELFSFLWSLVEVSWEFRFYYWLKYDWHCRTSGFRTKQCRRVVGLHTHLRAPNFDNDCQNLNYSELFEHHSTGGGVTGRVLELRSTGREFKSYSEQKLRNNLGHVVHTYVPLSPSSIMVYNLVPAKERWCSAAEKVTAGLAESNGGSLPPGGWLIVICGLTACTPGSATVPTIGNEYEEPIYLCHSTAPLDQHYNPTPKHLLFRYNCP